MNKIGIIGAPEWESQKREIYEQLCEKYILPSAPLEPIDDTDIAPVMLPPKNPPIKLCEFEPAPIEKGRGRSVMNEQHYQKQVAKRRKKNKNKKTHRK